ncbi:hypothetical protein LA345_36580 (plasmid) [Burkholderia vietnamiensis]|uniref:Uncharacterized protein n=1 Tax=Burkholderia vietnamiensis (strain G4 / LMG 22486) TaxID=269482 RepID=A4JVT9_BURVG|nr:hypothetical protein Bcep1808_7517 [Burkholderia vietnamiensis G4]MCB4349329.1 hypothetical protein [Burkholderia vietnamiensis]
MSIEMQRANGVKHWGETVAMVVCCVGAALLLHYLLLQYPRERRERLWQKNGLNACSQASHHMADRIAGATGIKNKVFLVAIHMTDDNGSYACKADVKFTIDGHEESEIWSMEGSRKRPCVLTSAPFRGNDWATGSIIQ